MKLKVNCFKCNKEGSFSKRHGIPWRIVAWNMALNEPYYVCPECDLYRQNTQSKLKSKFKETAPLPTLSLPQEEKKILYREI